MEQGDGDSCADDEEQNVRNMKETSISGVNKDTVMYLESNEDPEANMTTLNTGEKLFMSIQQERKEKEPTSYKNMLLGVNGADNGYNCGDVEMWEDEEDAEEEIQEVDGEEMDPFCPYISVTAEDRKILCRTWRKEIIIKMLGRRMVYRLLFGRLAKLWNLSGNFELIDLQNEFFLVRFVEMADYEKVLYDGP